MRRIKTFQTQVCILTSPVNPGKISRAQKNSVYLLSLQPIWRYNLSKKTMKYPAGSYRTTNMCIILEKSLKRPLS